MGKRYVLEKVQIWSALKVTFVLFLIIGAIIGLFYALMLSGIGFLAQTLGEVPFGGFNLMRGLGFVLIPVVAILYAIFATIAVAIWLLLYNLLAGAIGGIEIDLRLSDGTASPKPQPRVSGESGSELPEQKSINGF